MQLIIAAAAMLLSTSCSNNNEASLPDWFFSHPDDCYVGVSLPLKNSELAEKQAVLTARLFANPCESMNPSVSKIYSDFGEISAVKTNIANENICYESVPTDYEIIERSSFADGLCMVLVKIRQDSVPKFNKADLDSEACYFEYDSVPMVIQTYRITSDDIQMTLKYNYADDMNSYLTWHVKSGDIEESGKSYLSELRKMDYKKSEIAVNEHLPNPENGQACLKWDYMLNHPRFLGYDLIGILASENFLHLKQQDLDHPKVYNKLFCNFSISEDECGARLNYCIIADKNDIDFEYQRFKAIFEEEMQELENK